MNELRRETFVTGPLQVNCTVLACPETREAVIVDPGGGNDEIIRYIETHKLTPRAVVNTHAHFDHLGGVAELTRRFGVPFWLHAGDLPVVEAYPRIAASYGFGTPEPLTVDAFLEDGQMLPLGQTTLTVLHTPGHSPGGVCFYREGLAIVGDTLFAGSIGRTDFPGGDFRALIASIRTKLLTLPDDTVVVCGHGPDTTIGRERFGNPFLAP